MNRLKRSDKEVDVADLLYKFWEPVNRGEPIPKEVLETLSDEPSLSFNLIMDLFKKGKVSSIKDIPIEMIKSVAKAPEGARYLAAFINFKGEEIPEELIDGVIENAYHTAWLVVTLLLQGKDWVSIPKKLTDTVLSDSHSANIVASSLYKYKINKKIPKEIIDVIAKDPWEYYRFSQFLEFDKLKVSKKIQESVKKYKEEFEKQGSLYVRSKWLV
jgi:hypothetical protein